MISRDVSALCDAALSINNQSYDVDNNVCIKILKTFSLGGEKWEIDQ